MKAIYSAILAVCVLLPGLPTFAQPDQNPSAITLPIWPPGYLAPKSNQPAEHDATTAKDALVGGKALIRLTDVSDPTMTVYRPDPATASNTAILVLPGGGYRILAMDLEGTEICKWLNSIGVTAILVKYRVPTAAPHAAPLQDAERAIRLVRSHAQEWNADANRIGIMGFSAGGDLAARLSTISATPDHTPDYTPPDYKPIDKFDQVSDRPNFTILIYPAYLAAEQGSATLAPQLHVSHETPPAFLVQAEDDPVGVMNSIDYYSALARSKVPAEMHIYAVGGHGYGLRPSRNNVSTWPSRLEDWLRSIGMIAR